MVEVTKFWQTFPSLYEVWQAAPTDEPVEKDDAPTSAAQEIASEIDAIAEQHAATGELQR